MKDGEIFKEKLDYQRTRFTTRDGLIDLLVGTAVWGFVIVNYNKVIYDFFYGWFVQYGDMIASYFGYLGLGVSLTPIGLAITFLLSQITKRV